MKKVVCFFLLLAILAAPCWADEPVCYEFGQGEVGLFSIPYLTWDNDESIKISAASSDPAALYPMKGSVWLFAYNVGSSYYEDTLHFETQVETGSDNTVYLDAYRQPYSKKYYGILLYMDFEGALGGGQGFGAAIKGVTLLDMYFFKLDGDRATGYYGFAAGSYYSNIYAMTGGCISGCTGQVRNFVSRLYEYCLGREADFGGMENYASDLKEGARTGSEAAREFLGSQEFVNRNLDDADFLNALYWALFGRAPDADGHAGWMGKLSEGWTRTEVIDAFLESQEWYNLCETYGIEP